jgi:hypothetical protein
MTTRLQKFIERGSCGEGPARAAYVLDMSALPRPAKRKKWQRIDSFSAAEEVLNDPTLKSVLRRSMKAAPSLQRKRMKSEQQLSRSHTGIIGQHPDRKRVRFPTRLRKVLAAAGLKTVGEVRETVDKTLLSFQDLGPDSVAHLRRTLGLPSSGRDSGGRRSGFSPSARKFLDRQIGSSD